MNTKEAALVIGPNDEVLYRHAPDDRTVVTLPDSRSLWDVYWDHRHVMLGQAHSHPGHGEPVPSHTDITTYAACEAGLGKRYCWWIASSDRLVAVLWCGPLKHDYLVVPVPVNEEPAWVKELRRLSQSPEYSCAACLGSHDGGDRCPTCGAVGSARLALVMP